MCHGASGFLASSTSLSLQLSLDKSLQTCPLQLLPLQSCAEDPSHFRGQENRSHPKEKSTGYLLKLSLGSAVQKDTLGEAQLASE